MNNILLPFVDFNEDTGEKIGYFTGIYNFNPNLIKTIEPDADNDTVIYDIYDKYVVFKIKFEVFVEFVMRSNMLNIYFIDELDEYDKAVKPIIEKIKEKIKTEDTIRGHNMAQNTPIKNPFRL